MFDGVREEAVQGLPHAVGRLGGPAVALEPLRNEPVDQLGRHVFEQSGPHVSMGVLVGGGARASPAVLVTRYAGLQRFADGPEEHAKAADVVLVGLGRADGPQV